MIRKLAVSAAALTLFATLAVGSASESAEDKAARELRAAEKAASEAAADAEREARLAAAEADSTETATFLVRADVNTRKPNGKHWDIGKGKPDPRVRITVTRTGRTLVGEASKDAFTAAARFPGVRLNAGDTLRVELEDEDLGMSDDVGSCTVIFTPGGMETCELGAGWLSLEFQ